ncbi:MAG: acyloxyacyl hydrolase [Thermoanaerobaculia bacterium]
MALALPTMGRSAPWWLPQRIFLQAGQAFDPPSVRFAEFTGLAVARDLPLAGRLGGSVELYPLLLFNETKADHVTRERVAASALSILLTFDVGGRQAPWGLRLEAGSGLFYGYRTVPAEGSRFNFYDQLGGRLVRRIASERVISLGYRYAHISNLSLLGSSNPGLTFHTAVAAFDW